MFYTVIKHGFLTNQRAQGPIYILNCITLNCLTFAISKLFQSM